MKTGIILSKTKPLQIDEFFELIAIGKNGKLMTVLTFYNAKEVN